jgi:hypothetical protein
MDSAESCFAPSRSSHSLDDDEMGSKIRHFVSVGHRIPPWQSPADLTKTF